MTLGGFSIMDGAMTTGMFMAFQNLMGSFLFQLTGTVNNGEVVERSKYRNMILHDDFYKKFICRA